jgi:parallel beta-helix repeat protein
MAGIGSREDARPIIDGNECYENGMAGIGSREGAAPIIRNNRCYKNEMAGIGSRLGARPVIVDNDCYENKMAGIGSREGAAPYILNNRCYRNEMAGIGSRDSARPVIIGNESRENLMAGIGVRTESKALIIGNKCLENRLVAIGLPDGASAFIHGNELARTDGGAPPILALRSNASAVVSENIIRGGGVAGVLVQGTAHIHGNQFEGRGPDKQASAIWVPFGGAFNIKSTVTVSKNTCTGYRNLINASQSGVTAIDNTVSNYSGPAIIAKQPSVPPRVLGNIAFSDQEKDAVTALDEPKDKAIDNKLLPAAQAKELPKIPVTWLLDKPLKPEDCEQFQKVFGPTTVTDGLWKLVITPGEKPGEKTAYKLFNTKLDPEEKTDFAERVPHLAFRLKGLRERLEAEEFRKFMRKQ